METNQLMTDEANVIKQSMYVHTHTFTFSPPKDQDGGGGGGGGVRPKIRNFDENIRICGTLFASVCSALFKM